MRNSVIEHALPGIYYVGDLCYVFSDPEWDRVCKRIIVDEYSVREGRFFIVNDVGKEVEFYIFKTQHGDGEYDVFSVDSGTIGCVLLRDLTALTSEKLKQFKSQIIKFDEEFEVGRNESVIYIGEISIDTLQEEDSIYDDFDDADFDDLYEEDEEDLSSGSD